MLTSNAHTNVWIPKDHPKHQLKNTFNLTLGWQLCMLSALMLKATLWQHQRFFCSQDFHLFLFCIWICNLFVLLWVDANQNDHREFIESICDSMIDGCLAHRIPLVHTPRVSCYCYYYYFHWHLGEEAAAVASLLWYCYSLLEHAKSKVFSKTYKNA